MNEVSTPSSAESRPSLPARLGDTLRREVVAGLRPGDKLPSMRVLCDRYTVSINTVGAALDILAAEGMVEKRHGSGVFVAERAGRWKIGILSELDLLDSRISPFFRALAGEVRRQLLEAGAEPRLYVGHVEPGTSEDEPTCPEFWADIQAGVLDGAVIVDAPTTAAWDARLRQCPVPLVGANTVHRVDIDFDHMIRVGVERLAASGCRRLGLLGWRSCRAFEEAVAAHGIETRQAWIRHDFHPGWRGAGWEQFREIWLASRERPEGLVILDDMLLADAQLAILELGIAVPGSLQLAVLVNRDASPPVRVPAIVFENDPAELAAGLTNMILRRLGGEPLLPEARLLPPRELGAESGATTQRVPVSLPHHP